MQLVKILLCSLLLFSVANADELQEHRYDLPTSKQHLPACHSPALALYSGIIQKQSILQLQNHFFVQYDIQMPNKETRTVVCNLNNGQIIQAQTLADFQ